MKLQTEAYWFTQVSGIFGFIGQAASWSTGKICMIALGTQSCERLQNALTLIFSFTVLVCILYGLDWMIRPLIFAGIRLYRAYRWVRGMPDEVVVGSVGDCDWRGPATEAGVDNDFYRNVIRARSLETRKPNHLVVYVDGQYARCSRAVSRVRQCTRHGQLWEIGEVISASTAHLRGVLEAQEKKLICCCRELVCTQPEIAEHVKIYTAVDADLVMDLHKESNSPTWLCCLKMRVMTSTCWSWAKRGCMPVKCRRGCCRCKRRRVVSGSGKHPDSESEAEEMVLAVLTASHGVIKRRGVSCYFRRDHAVTQLRKI